MSTDSISECRKSCAVDSCSLPTLYCITLSCVVSNDTRLFRVLWLPLSGIGVSPLLDTRLILPRVVRFLRSGYPRAFR
jgi:hypothetical protein